MLVLMAQPSTDLGERGCCMNLRRFLWMAGFVFVAAILSFVCAAIMDRVQPKSLGWLVSNWMHPVDQMNLGKFGSSFSLKVTVEWATWFVIICGLTWFAMRFVRQKNRGG